jgi:hypothetical protein
VLKRNVEILAERGFVGDRVNEHVAHVVRIAVEEPDPIEAGDARELFQQQRQSFFET